MNLKSFLLAATVTVTLFSCRDIREGTADYAIIPLPQHTEVTPQTKPFILDIDMVVRLLVSFIRNPKMTMK